MTVRHYRFIIYSNNVPVTPFCSLTVKTPPLISTLRACGNIVGFEEGPLQVNNFVEVDEMLVIGFQCNLQCCAHRVQAHIWWFAFITWYVRTYLNDGGKKMLQSSKSILGTIFWVKRTVRYIGYGCNWQYSKSPVSVTFPYSSICERLRIQTPCVHCW